MAMLGNLFFLAAFVCSIIILIHAFKASVGQGFLCLCVPFYVFYYAFARFEHPKKNVILAVWLAGWLVGGGLSGAGIASSVMGEL